MFAWSFIIVVAVFTNEGRITMNKQMRTFMSFIIMAFGIIMGSHTVYAKTVTYQVTVNEDATLCVMQDQKAMTNCYATLKKTGTGYAVAKPMEKGAVLFHFDSNGTGTPSKDEGYISISYNGKKQTYWIENGKFLKNQIVGNKKKGYRYVDTTGIVIKDKTVQYAVDFVVKHSKASDSKSKRLSSCYRYLWKNYKYQRFYGGLYPKAKNLKSYATYMFKTKKGNCHRYATCFAYIARVLGYDSKVCVGKVSGNHGGMTPHGWTLVKSGKNWLVCDPDMELNGVHDYMVKSTSCKTSVTRKCTLVVKDGVARWK